MRTLNRGPSAAAYQPGPGERFGSANDAASTSFTGVGKPPSADAAVSGGDTMNGGDAAPVFGVVQPYFATTVAPSASAASSFAPKQSRRGANRSVYERPGGPA